MSRTVAVSKKRFDFRLAIGSPLHAQSSCWHFWSRNNEVYVVHGGMGHVQKFSFHTTDLCRLAFTKEHGTPSTMNNRASHQWRRDKTSPCGSRLVTRVLRVSFATDLLSTALEQTTREMVNWIEPAPPGDTTVIDLMFTRDREETLRESVLADEALHHNLLAFKTLPNGEAYAITSWFAKKGTEMLRVPASHGQTRDLIISPDDPNNTGRPVRFTAFSNPKDGDLIDVWEFGGYWSEPMPEGEWQAKCDSFRKRETSIPERA